MIYLYLFGTCFHFIYVFMIIGKNMQSSCFFEENRLSNSIQFLSYPKQIVFLRLEKEGINGKIPHIRQYTAIKGAS